MSGEHVHRVDISPAIGPFSGEILDMLIVHVTAAGWGICGFPRSLSISSLLKKTGDSPGVFFMTMKKPREIDFQGES
jgi:hypothetical protein